MIRFSRRQIRSIRTTISQALGISIRRSQTPVGFHPFDAGLAVTACTDTIAIRHTIPDQTITESFTIPLSALAECEGSGDELVTFRRDGQAIIVEWRDRGVPQSARHEVLEQRAMPSDVGSTTINNRSLITALSEAEEVTDVEPSRYALNCIQLRGNGQILATDGKQAYVHRGFDFPWNDDLLVPASRLFTRRELADASQVAIGKSDEWVMLRADAWCIWLKINTEARFPRVDDHVPDTTTATTTMHLNDSDVQFLVKAMPKLPGGKEMNSPVTLDLNGQIVVRSRGTDERLTELELSRSRREGEQIRCSTNRNLLARAAALGFRDVYFHGPETPAVCKDQRRTFFWALLSKEGAIQPKDHMQRIRSDDQTVEHKQTPLKETEPTMRPEPTKDHQTAVRRSAAKTVEAKNPILAAEALRDSLKESLARTRELIASLRKRKKQSRLVESTLASLRQLQGVA